MKLKKYHSDAERNADTIMQVPDSLLTRGEKTLYSSLAMAGSDIYAYDHPSSDVWNMWVYDTRIILPPIEKRFEIVCMDRLEGFSWCVMVKRGDASHTITLEVAPYYNENDAKAYAARAARVIQSVINHVAYYEADIMAYDKTHH